MKKLYGVRYQKMANADKIKGCLDKMIAEQGAAIVDMEGQFWHCYKQNENISQDKK